MLDTFRDLGADLSRFTERWVPDSWVICMILTSAALLLAVFGADVGVEEAVLAWGDGVWILLSLAMQFTIAMVAAHACVSSPVVFRWLDRLASIPDPERPVQAIVLAGCFSLVTGYLNWALCLVSCALFVPFICRRNPNVDIRVLITSAYLGLGTVWHCGLSGSAPLILATPNNPLLDPSSGAPVVDRLFPVTETIFNSFNLLYMLVIRCGRPRGRGGAAPDAQCRDAHARAGGRDSSQAAGARGHADIAGRPHGGLPRLGVARCDPARLSVGSLDLDPGLRDELDDQRLQHHVPRGSAAAARAPGFVPARVPPGCRRRLGNHFAVSLLRGNLWRDAKHGPWQVDRVAVRRVRHPAQLPRRGVRLLDDHESFRSFGGLVNG